jgi:hypothetical protein
MKRIAVFGLALLAITAVLAVGQAGFGQLYYDGYVVRTVVPPAANPHMGTADLFVIMNGADGQLPVAGAGPGDRGYRGGKWAFNEVTWNTTPYLLTSGAEVRAAESAGDVTVTRLPENDFKCPIQP